MKQKDFTNKAKNDTIIKNIPPFKFENINNMNSKNQNINNVQVNQHGMKIGKKRKENNNLNLLKLENNNLTSNNNLNNFDNGYYYAGFIQVLKKL